jgi:hypothetical protein
LVCQDGFGVGSMKFHSSCLLHLSQGCPGDGSSLSCGGKRLTISNGDGLHVRNLFGVIDLLSTTIALVVRHIQILSSIIQAVLPPLPNSSNTVSGHSKLDCNSGNSATMQLAAAEGCKRECKLRLLSPLLSGLPLPLLTATAVVSPGASVRPVAASAAFTIVEKLQRTRKSQFCEFELQFRSNKRHHNKIHYSYHLPHLLGRCRALSCSKCQVHCRSTKQSQKEWGHALSLCGQTEAPKGVANSEFLLPSKYK